jgi:hypothetical protein
MQATSSLGNNVGPKLHHYTPQRSAICSQVKKHLGSSVSLCEIKLGTDLAMLAARIDKMSVNEFRKGMKLGKSR